MGDRKWTGAQQDAISARGGTVLVSAAAGSGKTAVLVERVISRLTDPVSPVDADRMLVVTFTRAAAAEMKDRIAARLSQMQDSDPQNPLFRRQQLLLSRASISTVHSFCKDLIQENFYRLGISPEFRILDDGEITDAHGRKVNFENTIIVMTSNAGSATKEGTVGFGRSVNEQDADRAMKALQQFLRPEFINRVDAVITFNRLSEENFHGIARIMLNELVGSLKEKGITFTYDDALVELLTKKSYSLTYGARNLRRTIQKELEDPMATKIIDSYEHPITQVKATVEDGAIRLYTL